MNAKTTILLLVSLIYLTSLGHASDKQLEKNLQALKTKMLKGEPIRVVTNQVYNAEKSVLWKYVGGKVTSKIDGIVIVHYAPYDYPGSAKYFAVRNYSGDAVDGKNISAVAMRVGEAQWGDKPIELWDCGTKPVAKK